MFSEVRLRVKAIIRLVNNYFTGLQPSYKQWLWFVSLWLCGLLTVLLIAKAIKFALTFLRY